MAFTRAITLAEVVKVVVAVAPKSVGLVQKALFTTEGYQQRRYQRYNNNF